MAWKQDKGMGETTNACAGYSSQGDVACEGVRQGVGIGGVDNLTGTMMRRLEQVEKKARKRE